MNHVSARPSFGPKATLSEGQNLKILSKKELKSVLPSFPESDQLALSRHAVLFKGTHFLTLPSGQKIALVEEGLKGGMTILEELEQFAKKCRSGHLTYFLSLPEVKSLSDDQLSLIKRNLNHSDALKGCVNEFFSDSLSDINFQIGEDGYDDLNTLLSQILENLPPKKTICDLFKELSFQDLNHQLKGKFFWSSDASNSLYSKTGVIKEIAQINPTQYQLTFEDHSHAILTFDNSKKVVKSYSYTDVKQKSFLQVFREDVGTTREDVGTTVKILSSTPSFLKENTQYILSRETPTSSENSEGGGLTGLAKGAVKAVGKGATRLVTGIREKKWTAALIFQKDSEKISFRLYEDSTGSVVTLDSFNKAIKDTRKTFTKEEMRPLLSASLFLVTSSEGEYALPKDFFQHIGIDMDFIPDSSVLDELKERLNKRNELIDYLAQADISSHWDFSLESFKDTLSEDLIRKMDVYFESLHLSSEADKQAERKKLVMDVIYKSKISPDQFKLMNDLLPLFTTAYTHFDEMKNTESVCVIGGTGSGKSTFVNFAMGFKMKSAQRNGSSIMELLPQEEQNVSKKTYTEYQKLISSPDYKGLGIPDKREQSKPFKLDPKGSVAIGYSAISKTVCVEPVTILTPETDPVLTSDRLKIIDFPGFSDTRGSEYEIVTNLSIDGVFSKENEVNVRAIVVVLYYQEFFVNRGGAFLERMQDLKSRFQNFLNPQNPNYPYFHFLINKCPSDAKFDTFTSDIRQRCASLEEALKTGGTSATERQLEIYKYFFTLLTQRRVSFVKLDDQKQRKELLRSFFELKPLPFDSSYYAGSFSETNVSDIGNIATATTEWRRNLCDAFKTAIKDRDIKEGKIKDLEKKKDTCLSDISSLETQKEAKEQQKVECEKEIKSLKENGIPKEKEEEILKQVEEKMKEIVKTQKAMLSSYHSIKSRLEEDLKDIESKISKSDADINQLDEENSEFRAYIEEKSGKSESQIIFERQYTASDEVSIAEYKPGTMDTLLRENRDVRDDDYVPGTSRTVKIGEYTGKLSFSTTIQKRYAVLPADTDLSHLKTGNQEDLSCVLAEGEKASYGKYKVELHMHERTKLIDAKLCPSDPNTITYQFSMQYIKGKELPYVRVVHILPTNEIYKADLNEAHLTIAHNAEQIRRAQLEIERSEDAKTDKEKQLEDVSTKISEFEKEMSKQKDQKTTEAIDDLIKAREIELGCFKKQIDDLEGRIQQNKLDISSSKEEIEKISGEIKILKESNYKLANLILYKWNDLQGLIKISKKMLEHNQSSNNAQKLKKFIESYEQGKEGGDLFKATLDSCISEYRQT